MRWTLVVPLKPLARAKSRLADTASDVLRPGLALAFAQDTVAAALACATVRGVAVVTGDALAGRSWPRSARTSSRTSRAGVSTRRWRTGPRPYGPGIPNAPSRP